MKTNQPNATIIYDGTCGLCGRLFPRLGWILARHGMRALPLQHSAARSISGASTEQLFTQLHVVTADRKLIGGVDALLFIASKFLLLRLLVALARIRWIHAMLDRGYRFIARNRYRIFGTCRIAQPNGSSNLPILSAFILLVCVTLVALLTRGNSPWVMMSCTAVSIYAACKWLTWRRAGRARRCASIGKNFAYLLLWPGMDAARFLSPRDEKFARESESDEVTAALGKLIAGATLLLVVARFIPADHVLLRGWCAILGIVLTFHFGILQLISIAWRSRGIDAEPVMRQPARARSLADFWGRRWNTAFRTLSHDFLYEPLRKNFTATTALCATFIASGLVHDAVISVPARGGFGLPTLYFLIQCAGILIERSGAARRIGLGRGLIGRIYALTFTLAPLPLLLHRPFVARVMSPMLDAISGHGSIAPHTLAMLLVIAGVLHLCITSAGIVMTITLDWRKSLSPLCGLTRHIIWTHGSFVLLTIIGFGAISLLASPSLASGSALARAVCGFVAIFWLARLVIQFTLFDARPFLTNNFLALGYHGLTCVFSYFVVVYGLAAVLPR